MATAPLPPRSSSPRTTDDRGRVLPLTRAGVWVLLVLAAANGLFLYFVPARADTDYAWSIKPAVNAAFIGAGFLAGTLATGLVLAFATRWRSFSLLPPALWVLATTPARGDDHPPGSLQVGLRTDLGVDARLRGRAAGDPVPGRAPAAEGEAPPAAGRAAAPGPRGLSGITGAG